MVTELHFILSVGHTECVGVLLAAGSLVDAVTTSGSTALHSAASNGHHEVVQHLVAAGADVDVQVWFFSRPSSSAIQSLRITLRGRQPCDSLPSIASRCAYSA